MPGPESATVSTMRWSLPRRGEKDLAALGRVVGGVVEKVAERVVQFCGIARHHGRIRIDALCDVSARARSQSAITSAIDRVEQRIERAGTRVERLLAGVQPREAQQIAHQPLHAERVAGDGLEEATAVGRVGHVVEERLDVAADGGQRRTQLMRDVGDEVTPDPIGPPQFGDVVQDEDGAAPSRGGNRRAAGDECGAASPPSVSSRPPPESPCSAALISPPISG